MRVCFDTFGCRLNTAEALQMEASFLARGWEVVENHKDADMIVVRGCSVTARAQRDCEKLIEHIRMRYPNKRLVVTGCLKEKRNEHWLADLAPATPERTARAYLKVQDGCACNCTFCIVPQFRGKPVSRDLDGVLDDAKRFIDAGYREIVVTGCNLSCYSSGGTSLAGLVSALAALDRSCRIRLGSIEPMPCVKDVVMAMAENENVCRFLHLAIQSGAPKVLSAMRRPYTIRDVNEIVALALSKMPLLAIGCDLMTGFPGETDLDYLSTKTLFSRIPISKAHIFPYSERPGTVAAMLPDALPREIRKGRARELAAIADDNRSKFAKRFIGKTVEIVVEDDESVGGWTGEYLWCTAQNANAIRGKSRRKELVRMVVTKTKGHQLFGMEVR